MSTQPATQKVPHEVYIEYKQGQQYAKGQELEVTGYPPPNLDLGDEIVFKTRGLAGELKLTFEHGSNFAKGPNNGGLGPHKQIKGDTPYKVERLGQMTDEELNDYQSTLNRQAANAGWSDQAHTPLEQNGFPFQCELILKGGWPKHP